jgi:hypothetical protein
MRTFYAIIMLFATPTLVAPTPPPGLSENIIEEPKVEVKDQNKFLHDIGFRESGNRYTIVNQFGYMGKYQFGKSTLRTLKIKVTKDAFLNSPDLQEYAMQQNLIYNKKKLLKYIKLYEGETIHGIFITESGILAAAHLAEPGSVRKFFRRGSEFKDGFGTSMTSYLEEFSGYELNINL